MTFSLVAADCKDRGGFSLNHRQPDCRSLHQSNTVPFLNLLRKPCEGSVTALPSLCSSRPECRCGSGATNVSQSESLPYHTFVYILNRRATGRQENPGLMGLGIGLFTGLGPKTGAWSCLQTDPYTWRILRVDVGRGSTRGCCLP